MPAGDEVFFTLGCGTCHAVFGKVIKGLDVVFAIEQGDTIQSIEIFGEIALPVNGQ